ncbi:MAG: hypothetical protein ACRD7E_22160 [Bryobacteraceae bacterium]
MSYHYDDAINVFEGARRIVPLLQVVWVIGCIVMVWNQTPYVSLHYATSRPIASLREIG